MRFLKHIFLAAAFAVTTAGTAQGLSINNLSFTANSDSIPSGNTYSFTAAVFNYSSLSYTGTINVYTAIDSMGTGGLSPVNLIIWDTAFFFVNNFVPSDSTTVSSSLTLTIGQRCRNGINTVVIWPVAADMSIPTQDSIRHDVTVYYEMSAIPAVEKGAIVVGPNPFSDQIDIICKGKISVEQVRIMDMRGIVVHTSQKKSSIETSMLSQGVYFVEVTFADGRKTIIKAIKQ